MPYHKQQKDQDQQDQLNMKLNSMLGLNLIKIILFFYSKINYNCNQKYN